MTYKSEVKNDKGYELVINDATFKSWITALEQKKKTTAHSYKYGLIYFSKFCNKLPNELLNEAKDDYINKVPPWDLRHVHNIERFATYLLTNQEQSISSKLNYIKSVKHFYNHFKIPVIGVKHNLSQGITEKYQNIPLLKIEDIRKAVLSCGSNLQAKAMILSLISSGQGNSN